MQINKKGKSVFLFLPCTYSFLVANLYLAMAYELYSRPRTELINDLVVPFFSHFFFSFLTFVSRVDYKIKKYDDYLSY